MEKHLKESEKRVLFFVTLEIPLFHPLFYCYVHYFTAAERLRTKVDPRYFVRTSSSAASSSGVPL